MTQDAVVEVTVHIAASPETVFGYFTDPARYVRWMGTSATLEPVPGGSYRVRMRDGVEVAGTFIDLDPPHRVEFTWGWVSHDTVPPGATRVVVTLSAEGGGTRVVLRHFGIPDEHQRGQHRTGWEIYLTRLGAAALGNDPGPDPNA